MNTISLNILSFPVWWYTVGLGLVLNWVKAQFRFGLSRTGLVLFARHLREPLFGDYTRSGIVVGFFLRIALLLLKALLFGIRIFFVLCILFLYIALLPGAIVMIIYQLLPL